MWHENGVRMSRGWWDINVGCHFRGNAPIGTVSLHGVEHIRTYLGTYGACIISIYHLVDSPPRRCRIVISSRIDSRRSSPSLSLSRSLEWRVCI